MQQSQFLLIAAVAVTCGISTAQSATLSTVPMQGGMVMPMVAYHADDGHLHMTLMGAEVPQLTPLLVSHPGTNFISGDPWYDDLDPARKGLSFSGRYGFVMGMSDTLPDNTAIWLRKLSGSPELGFYRYSGSAPKAWVPIFGTAGTTNALYWNTDMFHPRVTAPPGTNLLTATFEAYLVNTNTLQEVPDSTSGPLVLNWTNVPDGRPALEIGTRVVVAWPESTSGYVLEYADSATATVWNTVTNTPVTLDSKPSVVLDSGSAGMYFRMRKAP